MLKVMDLQNGKEEWTRDYILATMLFSSPCHPLPEGLLEQRFVGFEFQCCFCIFLIKTTKSPFFLIKGATHKYPFVFVSASLLGTSAGS